MHRRVHGHPDPWKPDNSVVHLCQKHCLQFLDMTVDCFHPRVPLVPDRRIIEEMVLTTVRTVTTVPSSGANKDLNYTISCQ